MKITSEQTGTELGSELAINFSPASIQGIGCDQPKWFGVLSVILKLFSAGDSLDPLGHWPQIPIRATILYIG